MPSYGYRSTSPAELKQITKRLVTPTRASSAAVHTFDPQRVHIEHLKSVDPKAYPYEGVDSKRAITPAAVERISRPTTASRAAAYDFDVQACHIDYLKQCDPEYPPRCVTLQLSDTELTKTVERVTKATSASRASEHDFDVQAKHVEYISQNDPEYPPKFKRVNGRGLKSVVSRLVRPTTASHAAKYDFDHQKVNLDHLSRRDARIPASTRTVSESDLDEMIQRLTRPTAASKAYRFDFDAQEEHLKYIAAHDPFYPGHKKYQSLRRCKSAAFQSVPPEKLSAVIKNLTKPTVASQFGAPLRDKKYEYVPHPNNKTFIPVKNADTKYMGGKKVSEGEFTAIVSRLSTPYERQLHQPKNSR